VRGGTVQSGQATILSASDIHAHNSFENPRALEPRNEKLSAMTSGSLTYRFAPASVTRLQLTLA